MRVVAKSLLLTLVAVLTLVRAAAADPVSVLYDGSLGTTPDVQSWLYLDWPYGTSDAVQVPSANWTNLDTTTVTSDSAGYFARLEYAPLSLDYTHPDLPVLDRDAGYRVTFDARIVSELHDNDNRAGFSILVLSDDLLGIELGFWEDEVWAQSGTDFLKAESASLDTTAMIEYDLDVVGTQYTLSADGTAILTGSLRDYSAAASGSNPLTAVYAIDNMLFLGDDTSSASASFDLAYVAVQTGTAVPEPSTLALLFSTAVALAAVSRRRLLNRHGR